MNKILCTGAAGFLGSHLLDTLLADSENEIWALDNHSTSVAWNVEHLQNRRRIHWIEDDLEALPILLHTSRTVHENAPHAGVDQIYHLASPVGPAGVLKHAGEIGPAILSGAEIVSRFARDWGAKLLFVSTSEVYGAGASDAPQGLCEEAMPCHIAAGTSARLEYAAAKLAAEICLRNLAGEKQIETVIVRPFNIAGPRQSAKGGFVLPRFVSQALSGEDLTIFAPGTQIRAFTHVQDIVDGLLLAMEKGRSGEVYNLGNPNSAVRIASLATRVLVACGREMRHRVLTDGKSVHGERFTEAGDKFPDITKARADLGYEPRRTLDDTIQDTIPFWYGLTPEQWGDYGGIGSWK